MLTTSCNPSFQATPFYQRSPNLRRIFVHFVPSTFCDLKTIPGPCRTRLHPAQPCHDKPHRSTAPYRQTKPLPPQDDCGNPCPTMPELSPTVTHFAPCHTSPLAIPCHTIPPNLGALPCLTLPWPRPLVGETRAQGLEPALYPSSCVQNHALQTMPDQTILYPCTCRIRRHVPCQTFDPASPALPHAPGLFPVSGQSLDRGESIS